MLILLCNINVHLRRSSNDVNAEMRQVQTGGILLKCRCILHDVQAFNLFLLSYKGKDNSRCSSIICYFDRMWIEKYETYKYDPYVYKQLWTAVHTETYWNWLLTFWLTLASLGYSDCANQNKRAKTEPEDIHIKRQQNKSNERQTSKNVLV